MSDLLSDVPGILAEVFDQGTISWRAKVGTGTWATLEGARLSGRHEAIGFDERRSREHGVIDATLVVPSTSDALQFGYEIKELDGTRWAVLDRIGDSDTGARSYTVRTDPTIRYAEDKGKLS